MVKPLPDEKALIEACDRLRKDYLWRDELGALAWKGNALADHYLTRPDSQSDDMANLQRQIFATRAQTTEGKKRKAELLHVMIEHDGISEGSTLFGRECLSLLEDMTRQPPAA